MSDYNKLNFSEIKDLMINSKNIAVVGLSSKPDRPSYGVAEYMQRKGYKIYPVNPVETEVLGEKAYPDLKSLPVVPDIVDVFRKSDTVEEIVDEALEIGAKIIWFQLGVINTSAIEKAEKSGMKVIVDKCLKVEHAIAGL